MPLTRAKIISAVTPLLCSLFLLFGTSGFAQTLTPRAVDSIMDKIALYGVKTFKPVIFVHFDKTVYTNNDNIWFTAYILDRNSDMGKHHVLSVALVKDDDRSIIATDKFVLGKGFAFGNLYLSDTIIAGNYSLIAYTDRRVKGRYDDVFVQPVTVKTTTTPTFGATLFVADTARKFNGATRKVTLMVTSSNTHALPGAMVNYSMGSTLHPFAKGKVVTDKAGQYEFKVPVNKLEAGKNNLRVQVKKGVETREATVSLPAPPPPVKVRFYPEGGNAVDNIPGVIGWEVKNSLGNPLKVSGVLYRNKKPIDTITTNSYGLGRFNLRMQQGNSYTVKIYRNDTRDTVFNLPPALGDGPALYLARALVNDTLYLRLWNARPGRFYVIGHNYRETFFAEPVDVDGRGKMVKVLLQNVPKGLAQVTVLDSAGRPCAERLFFAHFNRHSSLDIATDSAEYATRQKVKLNIRLSDSINANALGLVSVAVVQDNRVELRKMTDIESYSYLKHELTDLPLKENYMGRNTADRSYLEDILLIKGWRRYTWRDMVSTTPADTTQHFEPLAFKATVTHQYKKIKKPLAVVQFIGKRLSALATDSIGHFEIPYDALYMEPDVTVKYVVSHDNNPNDYKTTVTDPYLAMNAEIAQQLEPEEFLKPMEQTTESFTFKGFEHATHLKEVKIKGYDDRSLTANACGDYVCLYNILNCPNHRSHPQNRPPVVGHSYMVNGRSEVYQACDPNAQKAYTAVRGIYVAKEFYPSDYEQASPEQPEYVSTLYWKHLIRISNNASVQVTFFTSDIVGKFKVVVQGLANDDVVYGTANFNVVKKDGRKKTTSP